MNWIEFWMNNPTKAYNAIRKIASEMFGTPIPRDVSMSIDVCQFSKKLDSSNVTTQCQPDSMTSTRNGIFYIGDVSGVCYVGDGTTTYASSINFKTYKKISGASGFYKNIRIGGFANTGYTGLKSLPFFVPNHLFNIVEIDPGSGTLDETMYNAVHFYGLRVELQGYAFTDDSV